MSDTGSSGDNRGNRDAENGVDHEWTDPSMLEGVRRRDSKALAQFFDVAFPYVYTLAFRLMGRRETAEDVSQDVFVKVYQAADRLQVDRHPKPWLTTITYNTCRDAMRRAARRHETPEDTSVIGERPGDSSTPEDESLRREREELTERALLQLDDISRAVMILHAFCGVPHEDIAVIMEMSHAAVRKRYSRSLKRMSKLIKGWQS